MKNKTKKEKGDIGLAKVISDLTSNDFHVSLPISEHLKYDLIAEMDGLCKTIQVRFCSAKDNILKIKLKSVWSNKDGAHILRRKSGDFDYLAVYCPDNNNCYYVPDDEFNNSTQLNIRLEESTS